MRDKWIRIAIESVLSVSFLMWVFLTWDKLYLVLWSLIIPVIIIFMIREDFQIAALRKTGEYPQNGQGTDEDVQRLAHQGYVKPAMRLYREIHGTSLREAKVLVAKMQKGELSK